MHFITNQKKSFKIFKCPTLKPIFLMKARFPNLDSYLENTFFWPFMIYPLVPTGSGLETDGLGWGGQCSREPLNLTTRWKRTVPEPNGLVVVWGGSLGSRVPTCPALCCPSPDVHSNMLSGAQNLLEVLSRDWGQGFRESWHLLLKFRECWTLGLTLGKGPECSSLLTLHTLTLLFYHLLLSYWTHYCV